MLRSDDFKRDRRETGKMQLTGSSRAQIDDPILAEGSAIIDAHDDHSAVMQVGDANHRAERQRAVRRSELDGENASPLAVLPPFCVQTAANEDLAPASAGAAAASNRVMPSSSIP
mgnify:CR=1 FL=1